ncbi:hypothetical protein MPTK2_8g18710 [Marchantia polymorpha subsp. ruderalis]
MERRTVLAFDPLPSFLPSFLPSLSSLQTFLPSGFLEVTLMAQFPNDQLSYSEPRNGVRRRKSGVGNSGLPLLHGVVTTVLTSAHGHGLKRKLTDFCILLIDFLVPALRAFHLPVDRDQNSIQPETFDKFIHSFTSP